MRSSSCAHTQNYTKIYAQWSRPWWDVSVYKWAQANDGVNGGDLGSVRNLAHPSVLPGSNFLLFDLGDPQASVWEGLSDGAAKARLIQELRRTHPKASIPEPIAFHMTRHSRDPLSYGAYSAWGLSSEEEHHAAAAPLSWLRSTSAAHASNTSSVNASSCPPRVWLSGEAFCPNYNGFVHGGLFAGRRDARHVLTALGRKPPPPDGDEDSVGCDHPTNRLSSAGIGRSAEA